MPTDTSNVLRSLARQHRGAGRRSPPRLIEQILEEELSETLGRERYARQKAEPAGPVDISQGFGDEVTATAAAVTGYRNGRRER